MRLESDGSMIDVAREIGASNNPTGASMTDGALSEGRREYHVRVLAPRCPSGLAKWVSTISIDSVDRRPWFARRAG